MKFCLTFKRNHVKHVLKMVINNTTIGTQTIVVHVTERAVAFLSIPYGTRNILVLVIGRIELIIITENHALDISLNENNGTNIMVVSIGVDTTVRKNIFLTNGQWSCDFLLFLRKNSFLISSIFKS